MAKFSTGLRTAMLGTADLKTKMGASMLMKIYSGTVPADADAASGEGTTATVLCLVSDASSGTGLTLDTPAGGSVSKLSSQVWSGVNLATGTATFFRLYASGDGGAISTTDARVQGTVSATNGDMLVSNTLFDHDPATTFTLNYFSVALPTL